MSSKTPPSEITCPHCHELTSSSGERCTKCSTEFPWMNQIYQRETAIIRAVLNVGADVYESITSGKKVNRSKFIGLLNAVLMARATLVVGSLLGSIFIVVEIYYLIRQTEIINNQTQLISDQSSFMRFEQLSRIQELFEGMPPPIPEMYYTGPSETEIALVSNLVKNDSEAINTLFPVLLRDHNMNVRIGALKVILQHRDLLNTDLKIILRDSELSALDLSGLPLTRIDLQNCVLQDVTIQTTRSLNFHTNTCIIVNSKISKLNSRDELLVIGMSSAFIGVNFYGENNDDFQFHTSLFSGTSIFGNGTPGGLLENCNSELNLLIKNKNIKSPEENFNRVELSPTFLVTDEWDLKQLYNYFEANATNMNIHLKATSSVYENLR